MEEELTAKLRVCARPPEESRDIVLTGASAIRAWADEELGFWRPQRAILEASPQPFHWEHLESALIRLIELDESSGDVEALATKQLDRAVKVLGFTSRDPRSGYLRNLSEAGEEPETVAMTRLALVDPRSVGKYLTHSNWKVRASTALMYRAAWIALPSKNSVPAMGRALRKLHTETIGVLEGVQSQHADAVEARMSFEGKTADILSAIKEEWEETLRSFQDQYKALNDRLTTELSLRAPVDYWIGKANEHRAMARFYIAWFAGVGLLGGAGLILLAIEWLMPTLDADSRAWWSLVLFSVVIAAWAWPLRLTSKLYLAHTHLAEDSKERAVVAKTFLALKEVVELKDEDRHVLLAALFRSSSAGLVRDEGSVNFADLILAKVAGRD